jgi:hypothetical protein
VLDIVDAFCPLVNALVEQRIINQKSYSAAIIHSL